MGLLDGTTQSAYYNSGNSANYGNYQFTSLENIINAFMFAYVGEGKLLAKVNRTDVQFHAMRAMQELSYDVLRSIKSQEIEVPNTLKMILPQDYVNYVKISKVESDGIERILYPTNKTSNPFAITQSANGTYDFSPGIRKFTIQVPLNGGNGLVDGDYISLPFKNSSGNDDKVFIIFDDDNDTEEGNNPLDSLTSPRLYVSFSSADNWFVIAGKLKEQIMDFGHHVVTNSVNGKLTIEYTDGFFTGSTTPNLSTTESAYAEGTAPNGGVNGTNISIEILNAGSDNVNLTEQAQSNTWENWQNQQADNMVTTATDATDVEIQNTGRRYGIDPQHAQENGSFYIDQQRGYIHFGSGIAGKTVVLRYVSDGLGTDEEMVVHKFCEEACYKWIAYGVLSCRTGVPDGVLMRFKQERFAETRKAKIRLSNIKIEEFTQVLKGMSKQIK